MPNLWAVCYDSINTNLVGVNLFYSAEDQLRAWHTSDEYSTTELHPQVL